MVEYESENGFRLLKRVFLVIFDDFIMFYKPFGLSVRPQGLDFWQKARPQMC